MAASVVTIRRAVADDAAAFSRMREADAREVAALGFSPVDAVLDSLAASAEAWTALIDGEVACMFGVAVPEGSGLLDGAGVVWLLTTDTVDRYPVTFVKYSRAVVKDLGSRYSGLGNFVDARYQQALNWALRLGFEVHPGVPLGNDGEVFNPIWRLKCAQ